MAHEYIKSGVIYVICEKKCIHPIEKNTLQNNQIIKKSITWEYRIKDYAVKYEIKTKAFKE